MAHVIFCMPCCVRGDRIKSVPSIDQTPRWQCWEPSNAHTIGGLGVGRNVNHHLLLLLPSKTKVSELIVSQNKFWVAISWVDTCAKLKWSALAVRLSSTAVQQRDAQSEEWIRIPAKRAARHESQMDGNRWLAPLGTHCIILINYCKYEDTAKMSKVSLPGVWELSRGMWAENAAETMSIVSTVTCVTSDRQRIRSWW